MNVVFVFILLVLLSTTTQGSATAPRIQSHNGAWLLPVAGNVLCSDEQRHIGRGSVRAWDLCVPYGSAIYPLADGQVIYAGCNNAGGYGCWVMIRYANGFSSIMAHMVNGSITVQSGQGVRQGQQIGRVGWTGMTSFGPHVHLEIHHPSATSNRVMIDQYFNRALLRDCPLCNTPGEPVVASGTVGSTNGLRSVYTLSQAHVVALYGLLALLLLIYVLLAPRRPFMQGILHGFVIGCVVLLPLLVLQMPVGTPHMTGDKWETVYGFMRRWEGRRCTVDPVRTFAGIAQGTYDRYRRDMGMGPADVCAALTDRQAADIYYRYFYLASGADKLPTAIALHHFDFAVNAGVGSARAAYAACGDDFGCYTRYRISYYQRARLCSLYCAGWLRRVNDLVRFVDGGGQHDRF